MPALLQYVVQEPTHASTKTVTGSTQDCTPVTGALSLLIPLPSEGVR